MPTQPKFKPYVGRCFELKNYTDLKKYPPVVLVMDEDKNKVMFIDNEGNATWVLKFYIRDTPIQSRVFASPDTLTSAMSLIEKMRCQIVDASSPEDKKKTTALNRLCERTIGELRDLGSRMTGVEFAPPIADEEPSESKNASE
jgi:hypothetical protein